MPGHSRRGTGCRRGCVALLVLALTGCVRLVINRPQPDLDWAITGGDPGNSRSSPLAQIDRHNVTRLEVAWMYRTGEAVAGQGGGQIQATPIVVRGLPGMSARSTSAPGPYAGRSTRSRSRESSDTIPGRPIPGVPRAAPIRGRAWPWTSRAVSSTSPQARPRRISSAAIAPVRTCSRTRSSRWTQRPGNACGTSRPCIRPRRSRSAGASQSSHRASQRAAHRRRGSDHQDGVRLPLRSRDRHPALPHRRTAGARVGHSR
jgi:hypothetical protein